MPDFPTVNPFRDLYDAAVRYPSIKLTCCRCRHTAIFSTHALWYHFDQKGWRDDFRQVQRRCVCLVCWFHGGEKVRNPDLEFVNEPPTDARFPTPPEFAWMQERRRRR